MHDVSGVIGHKKRAERERGRDEGRKEREVETKNSMKYKFCEGKEEEENLKERMCDIRVMEQLLEEVLKEDIQNYPSQFISLPAFLHFLLPGTSLLSFLSIFHPGSLLRSSTLDVLLYDISLIVIGRNSARK